MAWISRVSLWMSNRLWDWLRVYIETEIEVLIQARHKEWENAGWVREQIRREEFFKSREEDLRRRESEMEKIAAMTTMAASDVMTQIQLARKHWEAVVKALDEEKEEDE